MPQPTQPSTPSSMQPPAISSEPTNALLQRIRDGVIGQYTPIETPFGTRPLVYADYTASGRSLDFIESQLWDSVLPYYANTHSESSFTGAQSTALREQARRTIAHALNLDAHDRLIFCGAGATAAINLLVDILNLRLPRELDERYGFSEQIPEEQRPAVFVGPYEHHSNELPWRESIADVIRIPLDAQGHIDQLALADALHDYRHRPLKIGSFSAASNVTGLRSDVQAITRLLKREGALAFWDYAAAAPYVAIDMNGGDAPIDALFLSPHKFIGGPGTPGILVLKEQLFSSPVPARVGGGTVSYVTPTSHHYLEDHERREEGGTPAIVESVRAGLVFALQQRVGTARIEDIEQTKVKAVFHGLSPLENLEILGPQDAPRLAIFSLRFHHAPDRELHYGFVVALLSDLFGIQARGGCSCAGPYGHALLAIDAQRSERLEHWTTTRYGCLRPGWVRLNFNYFLAEGEFAYLLKALSLVAEHGWRLLPSYALDTATGLWRHRSAVARAAPGLLEARLDAEVHNTPVQQPDFQVLIQTAEATLLRSPAREHISAALTENALQGEAEDLRWFLSGREAAMKLRDTVDLNSTGPGAYS
ncbi:MAG: selenocysteine lyase/cysteine desulfurase [Halieaceae bacterium]|jgi:selenocysteine lyase/cysteine desulfurase